MLITDPVMPAIRPTEDVDLLGAVADAGGLSPREKQFAARGFVHDMSPDAPVCRWLADGIKVDVMPVLEKVLGFSNPWYPLALETAAPVALPSGTMIRLIAAPVFLASKLEAFSGRGQGDYLFSHDLGDFLAVIDGRESLLDECRASRAELRAYLAERVAGLLGSPDLEGKLRELARLE